MTEFNRNLGDREALGRCVREAWTKWALTQPDERPDWLEPWECLPERIREVDCQIGEAVRDFIMAGEPARPPSPPCPAQHLSLITDILALMAFCLAMFIITLATLILLSMRIWDSWARKPTSQRPVSSAEVALLKKLARPAGVAPQECVRFT